MFLPDIFEDHHQQGVGTQHVLRAGGSMTILVSVLAPVNTWTEALVIGFTPTSGDGGFAGLRLR